MLIVDPVKNFSTVLQVAASKWRLSPKKRSLRLRLPSCSSATLCFTVSARSKLIVLLRLEVVNAAAVGASSEPGVKLKASLKAFSMSLRVMLRPFRGRKAWLARALRNGQGEVAVNQARSVRAKLRITHPFSKRPEKSLQSVGALGTNSWPAGAARASTPLNTAARDRIRRPDRIASKDQFNW